MLPGADANQAMRFGDLPPWALQLAALVGDAAKDVWPTEVGRSRERGFQYRMKKVADLLASSASLLP